MEIKVKGELPEWTQKAQERCGIEQVSFSKYAHALEQGLGDELVPSVEIMEQGELFQDHKEGLLPAEIWKQRKLWNAQEYFHFLTPRKQEKNQNFIFIYNKK